MSFSDGASGDTLYFKWTSRSGNPPVPTTLAGSPVISIYKDASLTQSTAGVTLTADFDSVTGLNHVSIDTTADATFYANGHKYYLVITTGTVGGTSVVGEVVGEFMLRTAALTAAQIATGVWQDTTSGDFTVASSIGKSLFTSGAVPGAAGGLFIAGTNAATTITTALTTTFTGNLTGSVGSVTGTVGSVTGNVGGYSGVDWARITNTTTTVDLSGTTIKDLDSGNSILAAVSNIAVTSAALNTTAASETLTTGTDTGGLSNTYTLDGTFDNWADVTGTIDGYYEFNVSGTTGAVGVGVTWDGYLIGVANSLKVYAYNWGASGWDQIGTIVGIAGTVVAVQEWDLTSAHTGTGGNAGKVRIRFNNTGLVTATLKTDRILLGYAVVLTPPTNWSLQSINGSGVALSQLADALTHGGASALLQLGSSSATPAFLVQNSAGDAAQFTVTGSNGSGLNLTGHGTAGGLLATGGGSALQGARFQAGTGSGGNGLGLYGDGNGDALHCLGGATAGGASFLAGSGSGSYGLFARGDGAGQGAWVLGGSAGIGFRIDAGVGSGQPGVQATGNGSGNGILAIGGANGNGLALRGGSSSGSGLLVQTSADHGIFVQSAGSGKHGLFVTATTNADAVHLVGVGTGHGLFSTSGSGATGDGIHAVSVATNGDGFSGIGNGTGVGFRSAAAAVGFGGGSGTVDANVTSINGTTFTGANVPCILADGVAHGGTPGSSTATLAIQSLDVTNPTGADAVHFESTGSGGAGFSAGGAGASPGAIFTGGASGSGLTLIAAGGGSALNALVAGAGAGINISPDAGNGIVIQSGGFSISGSLSIVNSTGGYAISAIAGGGNASGVYISGHGTGAGIMATGGASNGPGLSCVGLGSAAGIKATGGNSGGAGIFALGNDGPGMSIESSTGDGLRIYSDSGSAISYSALASFILTDTGWTAADIVPGSVVYLSRHSIAGLGF